MVCFLGLLMMVGGGVAPGPCAVGAEAPRPTVRPLASDLPPVITQQPQSQTVNVGDNVTFTVSAIGFPPPTYQWQKDGFDLPGETSPTLLLSNVAAGDAGNYQRHIDNIRDAFGDLGLACEDPMGQRFNETRTDLDATISGASADNLVVVEVIKPIIRAIVTDGSGNFTRIVQKGIVVVQANEH